MLTATTRAPVLVVTNSVFFQRLAAVGRLEDAALAFGPNGDPSAAAQTMSGLVGWTTIDADLARVLEPDGLPRPPGVGRLVGAAADDDVAADRRAPVPT